MPSKKAGKISNMMFPRDQMNHNVIFLNSNIFLKIEHVGAFLI